MSITCNKRQKIREEVQVNIVNNAEYMVKKYAKAGSIEVADYNFKDTVSLKIPSKHRHAADLKRLPCIVIDKSSGNQPSYKLLCEYGVLTRRFTSASLMPFPHEVKGGDPKDKITVQEAARRSSSSVVIFCGCKGTCKTKQCKCRTASVTCSSRCHKGQSRSCKNSTNSNYEPTNSRIIMPKFGGSCVYQGDVVDFINTCPADTWLALFKVILPEINNIPMEKPFERLIRLVKFNEFNAAKLQVAEDNKLRQNKSFFSLLSSEYELIIKPYLSSYLQHTVSSKCNSKFCPSTDVVMSMAVGPTIFNFGNSTSKDDFKQQIVEWNAYLNTETCGRRIAESVNSIPSEFYFEDITLNG